jgi:phage N-6-adenine-methyltransferase
VSVAAHRFDNALRYGAADHQRNTQLTPSYVLDLVRADLGHIGLDPCTEPDNPTGASRFYTVEDDGLAQPWSGFAGFDYIPCFPPTFVNPPYAKAREPWVERCIAAAAHQPVVLLIPAATDTRIFQRAAASADAVVFVRGRLKFGVLRPNRRQVAASHGSALLGWGTDLRACAALGWAASSHLWGDDAKGDA